MKQTLRSIFALSAALIPLHAAAGVTYYNTGTKYAITEVNGSKGASTARPMIASGIMGVRGISNKALTETGSTGLYDKCKSLQGTTTTAFPESCSPLNMAKSMNSLGSTCYLETIATGGTATSVSCGGSQVGGCAASDQACVISQMISFMYSYQTPVLFPAFGRADHWATITHIMFTNGYQYDPTYDGWQNAGCENSSSYKCAISVDWYDGGDAAKGKDAGGNNYSNGLQSYSGATFGDVYFKTLKGLTSTGSDYAKYNGKYVYLWDPPTTSARTTAPEPVQWAHIPGIVGPGERMSAELASERVFEALSLAGVDTREDLWPALAATEAGPSQRVLGRTAEGGIWVYFLTPLLNADGQIVAQVILRADDGAWGGLMIPTAPVDALSLDDGEATNLARRALRQGERVIGHGLSFDMTRDVPFSLNPAFPWYSFDIEDALGNRVDELLVTSKGEVYRGLF